MNTIDKLNAIIDTQKIRYFRFQKALFLSEIKGVLDQEGIEAHLLTDTYRNQKYHSLVVGNLKDSKKIVVTHYDTPSIIYNIIPLKPFESPRRQRISMIIDSLKSLFIVIIVSFPLFWMMQNILNGKDVTLNGVLSLSLFLASILFMRLPIIIPSFRNENSNTLKYIIEKILEKEDNTSFVLVDDGMSFQLGYQILSNNLNQFNYKHEIHLLDQIKLEHNIKQFNVLDDKTTTLKFFIDLKVNLFTS